MSGKLAFSAAHMAEHAVRLMCRVLGVSRSWFHAWQRAAPTRAERAARRELSGGKPIVATTHLFENVSLAGLREIWNEFAQWKRDVEKTLPEEERLFSTKMNGLTVWVIEDA